MFGTFRFDASPPDRPSPDASDVALRMAGEAGQVSLALTAGSPGARARVDQHAAEVRETLSSNGIGVTPRTLVSYARGVIEAAIGRGWWPPHLLPGPDRCDAGALDWESLRLAAVCDLLIGTEPGEGKLSRDPPW